MSFALCQQINIKKNGNLFVKLYADNGFNFSWNISSTTSDNGKQYLLYQMKISKVSDKIQLDSVQVLSGNNTYTIFPEKLIVVKIPNDIAKIVKLNVSWSFKIAVAATNGPSKSDVDSVSAFLSKTLHSCYMCHRLHVKANNQMFIELKDKSGYILTWTREKKTKKIGKRHYRVYHFIIRQMNNGLQFDKLELKCQNSSYEISPGKTISVSMLDDEPRLVELNVFWSVKNDKLKSGENMNVSVIKTQTSTVSSLIPPIATKQSIEETCNHNEPAHQSTAASSKASLPQLETSTPTISEPIDTETNSSLLSTLNDAFTTKKYSDVVFFTNDSKKVFAHRCILFSHSEIFEALFDQAGDIPVKIEADFSENVTQKAVDFCYGKIDGIENFEEDLIKFADQYGIKTLKKACLKSLKDQQLTTENVCKIVEIAFEHNYTLLKQKCLQFIAQNKTELGYEKLSKLPVEIVISAFLSR